MSQPSTNSIHAVTPLHLLSRLLVRFHVARVALWYTLTCERCARTSDPAETELDAIERALKADWQPRVVPDPDKIPETFYYCPDCARMERNELKTIRTMTERNIARQERDAARSELDALSELTRKTRIPWEDTDATRRSIHDLNEEVRRLKRFDNTTQEALDAIAEALGCNDPFESVPALRAACLDAVKQLRARPAPETHETELYASLETRRLERDHAREDLANFRQRTQILENALTEIRGGRLAPCACEGGCVRCADVQGMPRYGVVGFADPRGTL